MSKYKDFEQEAKFWLKELENYNEGPFSQQTPASDWTIGQVYQHLFLYTEYCCGQIDKAIAQKQNDGSKTNFSGKMLFSLGSFVGKKAKDNKAVLTDDPEQPENIMDARNKIIRCLKTMDEASNAINLHQELAKNNRVEHPVFGGLNATQWFDLVVLYFKNYRKQKSKIDNHFMR